MDATWVGQLMVTAFFAVAFLQSAVDKWADSAGNLEFLGGHFANSPLSGLVPAMLRTITILESLAGVVCALGAVLVLLGAGPGMATLGLALSLLALLCLFFGQRLAKDYVGAAVIASYFAVALLGLILLG